MKNQKKLRIGLPQGSLNNLKRCNLAKKLEQAGYNLRGYEPGDKSMLDLSITNDSELEAVFCRPQNAPEELARGDYDIAVIGRDWVTEWRLGGINVEELLDLGIGKTRIVIGIAQDRNIEELDDLIPEKGSLRVYSEYPNCARAAIMSIPRYNKLYGNKVPVINVGGKKYGDNDKVEIVQSFGGTEWAIPKGSADFIVECVQNGDGIRSNGVKDVAELLLSTAGLYCRPDLYKNKQKLKKALEVRDKLRNIGKDSIDFMPCAKKIAERKSQAICGSRTKVDVCAEVFDQFGSKAMLDFYDRLIVPAGYY